MPVSSAVYEEIPKDLLELVEDVLLNRRPDATERLLAFAESQNMAGLKRKRRLAANPLAAPKHALIQGIVEFIEHTSRKRG
jgi:5-methyltetrahydrofolate--homocysteine methyltransferase